MRIILDTDIGDDIDDSFALAYLLKKTPDELKMILTCNGHTKIRSQIAASQIIRSGTKKVVIGSGVENLNIRKPYMTELCDYDINEYDNYYEFGIDKALELIKEDPKNTIIIAIGPACNIAEMIKREPKLMENIKVYAMYGSIKKGYFGANHPDKEYNVLADIEASKIMVSKLKNLYIAPLDTCSLLNIEKSDFDKFKYSEDKIVKALMDDYNKWLTLGFFKEENRTSCLYDTEPIYMCLDGKGLVYEKYKLKVDDIGNTIISEDGNEVNCAMHWKNGQEEFLKKLSNTYSK